MDDARLRRFMDEHYRRVVAALTLMAGSQAAAEDAVQTALAKAWLREESGYQIDNLSAWIWRVASNRAISGWRRLMAERRAQAKVASPRPESVDESVWDVQRALQDLPRRQRQVVTLRYFLQMRVPEIAETLGIGEGTVKTCLHRARRTLVGALGNSKDEEERHAALG